MHASVRFRDDRRFRPSRVHQSQQIVAQHRSTPDNVVHITLESSRT
jgi:hypothetical protein